LFFYKVSVKSRNNLCRAKIVKILYSVKCTSNHKFILKIFYLWTSKILAKSSKIRGVSIWNFHFNQIGQTIKKSKTISTVT
jgi:hypothetical protein